MLGEEGVGEGLVRPHRGLTQQLLLSAAPPKHQSCGGHRERARETARIQPQALELLDCEVITHAEECLERVYTVL